MKNTTKLQLGTILTGSLLCAALAFAATDYSAMTNEELAAQRGSMKQSTIEERNAFQNEWQNRVQKMSPEEKQKAMGQPESGQGQGGMRAEKQERNQERMQQRQDQGSGMGGGMGSGSGMGGSGMGSGSGMGGRGSMGGGRR